MGTNYYALLNTCECCSRPEKSWHICKSFRTFRAYTYDGPFGETITELQHWLPVLRDERIVIRDEYGVGVDKEEFIAKCLEDGKRDLSYDEYRTYNHIHDPAGYVLYPGEFF